MKTTVDLPDSLYRRAKIRAAERGTTLLKLLALLAHHGIRFATTDSKIPANCVLDGPGALALIPEP